jgi:hypothetical protein
MELDDLCRMAFTEWAIDLGEGWRFGWEARDSVSRTRASRLAWGLVTVLSVVAHRVGGGGRQTLVRWVASYRQPVLPCLAMPRRGAMSLLAELQILWAAELREDVQVA